jgi:hypothetical protein
MRRAGEPSGDRCGDAPWRREERCLIPGLHRDSISGAAPERNPQAVADRVRGSLMIEMGVSQRMRTQGTAGQGCKQTLVRKPAAGIDEDPVDYVHVDEIQLDERNAQDVRRYFFGCHIAHLMRFHPSPRIG